MLLLLLILPHKKLLDRPVKDLYESDLRLLVVRTHYRGRAKALAEKSHETFPVYNSGGVSEHKIFKQVTDCNMT